MEQVQGYYTILIVVTIVSVILIKTIFSKARVRTRQPPGPLGLPIIGHLHLLQTILHQALHKLSKRYGPVIQIFLGSVPCIVVSSSEMAKEFLKANENFFHNRPTFQNTGQLTYGAADFIFTPYGPYWRLLRKLCMSELLSVHTLNRFRPVCIDEIKGFMISISNKSQANKPITIRYDLANLTNNVISRMSIGETNCDAQELRNLAEEVTNLLGEFNLSDYIGFLKNIDIQRFGPRVKNLHKRLDAFMEKIMKGRDETRAEKKKTGVCSEDRKDILDLLLDVMEDDTSEMKLSRESIKSFILEMFVAGTNGPASAIEWALALLINHKDKLNKARDEITSVVGNKLVEDSDLQNLPYLEAIVKESMRMHPTCAYFARKSIDSCQVGGYDIPANAMLIINVWAIGRDPKNWENPNDFYPERFIPMEGNVNASQVDVRGFHYDLLPFGTGRRGCPGISLSLLVVQLTLARMIQCFDWNANDGCIDMTEGNGLSAVMAKPLICTATATATAGYIFSSA